MSLWSAETFASYWAPTEATSSFNCSLPYLTALASIAKTPWSRLSNEALSEPLEVLERCSTRCSCASPACSVPVYVPSMGRDCGTSLMERGSRARHSIARHRPREKRKERPLSKKEIVADWMCEKRKKPPWLRGISTPFRVASDEPKAFAAAKKATRPVPDGAR